MYEYGDYSDHTEVFLDAYKDKDVAEKLANKYQETFDMFKSKTYLTWDKIEEAWQKHELYDKRITIGNADSFFVVELELK